MLGGGAGEGTGGPEGAAAATGGGGGEGAGGGCDGGDGRRARQQRTSRKDEQQAVEHSARWLVGSCRVVDGFTASLDEDVHIGLGGRNEARIPRPLSLLKKGSRSRGLGLPRCTWSPCCVHCCHLVLWLAVHAGAAVEQHQGGSRPCTS